jgi:hypothetical protein
MDHHPSQVEYGRRRRRELGGEALNEQISSLLP